MEDKDTLNKIPVMESLMLQKPLNVFTQKEEECVDLLIETGIRENIARILVYLANRPEATFRDLEIGADVSLPDVSKATKYLIDKGWIQSWQLPSEKTGHMFRKYKLSVPFREIIVSIEQQKNNQATNQIILINKMRNYISES